MMENCKKLMKNSLKFKFLYYKNILNHEKYNAILLLCLFCSFISSYDIPNNLNYEEAFLSHISSGLFQLLLFIILFITSITTYTICYRKISSMLRYANKNIYISNIMKNITIINLIIFLCYILMSSTIITIKHFTTIAFTSISIYNIPYIIYNIFTIIKYFFIINIIILFSMLFYIKFNKIIGFLCFSLLLILKDGYLYTFDIINTVFKIKLFFGYYLLPIQYKSFYLEVICSIIYIVIIYCLYHVVKKVFMKYGNIKYED